MNIKNDLEVLDKICKDNGINTVEDALRIIERHTSYSAYEVKK
jgi:hypothetical protein